MARLMTQFALGAAITALILHVLFPDFRYKTTVIFLGGMWALVPELHLLIPVFEESIRQLSKSRLADLFWLHWSLNRHVTDHEFRRVGAFMISVLFLVVLGTEWHENNRLR